MHFAMQSKWVKGALTVVGAVLLSTLGIYAADSLQGIDGNGQFAGAKRAGVSGIILARYFATGNE